MRPAGVTRLALAVAAGCADIEAPISLEYGRLTEDHEAGGASGCAAVHDAHRGDVALSSASPRVSRSLRAGAGSVRFDFAAEPAVVEGGATLTLTASARTQAAFCGNECPSSGSDGTSRFVWRGAVSLPSPRSYRVRIAFDAWRETDLSPLRFAGECQVETPWRAPVVVESGRQSREVDAPAGTATIALNCQPVGPSAFAHLACYGAPRAGAPSLSDIPSVMDVRLTVRFTFTPKPE